MIGCIIGKNLATPSSLPPLIGWNEPGSEVSDSQAAAGAVMCSQYLFPGWNTTGTTPGGLTPPGDFTGTYDNGDFLYAKSKGINFVNIPFTWVMMQPTLNGTFLSNNAYIQQFKTSVSAALALGFWVMIRCESINSGGVYAGWGGKCIGQSGGPTNANFANLWGQLATLYKDQPKMIFDLFNEPNCDNASSQTTALWYSAAQAAITQIRTNGFVGPIFVEGMGYSQATSWLDGSYYDRNGTGESNGTGWLTLTDPINNLVACCHLYGDSSTGYAGECSDISTDGTGTTANNNVFVTALTLTDQTGSPPTGMLNWAITNKIRIFIGETGCSPVPSVGSYTTAMSNFKTEIAANLGTIIGLSWWSAGASYGGWYAYEAGCYNEPYCIAPSGSYNTDSVAYPCFSGFLSLITGN